MSIFRELLSIKAFRENKAEIAVRKQRGVLAEATREMEAAHQRLDEFRAYAQRHERELFDDLCRRVVILRDIQTVQNSVTMMREQEQDHAKRLDQAEDERSRQEQVLDECKAVHQTATRIKEKFVELARVHVEEQVREFERKEDAEMEEVAETRRDRSDWDEREEAQP